MKRKSTHATYTAAKRAGLLALAACLIFTGCGGSGESAALPDGPAPMEEVPALLRPPPAVAAFLAGAGEAALEERTGLICYAPSFVPVADTPFPAQGESGVFSFPSLLANSTKKEVLSCANASTQRGQSVVY